MCHAALVLTRKMRRHLGKERLTRFRVHAGVGMDLGVECGDERSHGLVWWTLWGRYARLPLRDDPRLGLEGRP